MDKYISLSHLKQVLSSIGQRFKKFENKLDEKASTTDLADVASSIPSKTSDLTNDSSFLTSQDVYTKTEINNMVGNVETLLSEI